MGPFYTIHNELDMSSIHSQTAEEIRSRLIGEFAPIHIEVIDDSYKHVNHSEAKTHPRAGHFHLIMQSAAFNGKSKIEQQRMVYTCLGELMTLAIHALSMDLQASH